MQECFRPKKTRGHRPRLQQKRQLILQELVSRRKIALLIGVWHAWPVLPFPGPLHGLRKVHRIFNDTGIDQRLLVRTELKPFGQAFLSAAGQRCG